MHNSQYIHDICDTLVDDFCTRSPDIIADELCILMYEDLGSTLGFYKFMLNTDVIFVNSTLDENRLRIVLAHELGHLVLHQTVSKMKTFRESALFESTDRLEYEANAFAAHLLIEDDTLLEYAKDGYTTGMIASLTGVPEELVLIKVCELIALGEKLNLPYEPNAKFLRAM